MVKAFLRRPGGVDQYPAVTVQWKLHHRPELHGYDDAGPPGGGHAEGDLAALTLEEWVGVLDP